MDQPISSAPPVFTPTPAVLNPPKKSYKWLIVATIAFLLTSATVFAYKYYQLKQQTTQVKVLPTPTPSVAASPVADPAADWKTYTNTQYKYSVKYPPDYSVIETSSDYVRFSPGINDPNLPQRETYLSIQLDKNPQQLPEAVYKKTADGKTLRISQILMDVDENQNPQIKTTFDLILSTFQFTGQDQNVSCGGWDTSGEIICDCSGKLNKPECPPDTICDGGSYTCDGQCGNCCYKGFADNPAYPKCTN